MVKKESHEKRLDEMQIVLCDDNPGFLKILRRHIQSYAGAHDWNCQFSMFSSPSVLLATDLSHAHVIFLDIDMPGVNGIAAAKQLRERYPELVIVFVTAYIEYARDGYKVEAFRYLMKDALREELPICLYDIEKKLYSSQESISVTLIDQVSKIQLKEILYFGGTSQRHVVMITKSGSFECLGKLSDYDNQLKGKGFLRIQRSYLVNMRHIDRINNYFAYLVNGEELKISERRYSEICRSYLLWKGQHL